MKKFILTGVIIVGVLTLSGCTSTDNQTSTAGEKKVVAPADSEQPTTVKEPVKQEAKVQEDLPQDLIKRIEAIVNKVSPKIEITVWDAENFASETTNPPYEVIINAGNGDIGSCFYAKNVAYKIMKGLYSDEIVKNKISRVLFTSWGHLRTSVGSVDGIKTDWKNSGPTNFWKVMMDYNPREDETGALNQRTWGKEIGADCK